MKLLREMLTELFGNTDRVAGHEWHQQQAALSRGEGMEHWLITPQGKKYGPFKTPEMAKTFLSKRGDIPRDSKLKSIRKGSTI